jgi:hypothetical protein
MTRKELEKAKKSLPKWKDGKPPVYTYEQMLLKEKISCIDMIDSILIYNGSKGIFDNRYLKDYINELGLKTVAELVIGQVEDISKSTILRGVHTDNEGLSYNSIIWYDEQ